MIEVSIWIKLLKNALKATIPDRDVLTHEEHPKLDYAMLLVRNNLVGAAAYVFECLLLTDYFRMKVPHKEMIMVYCLGPLYLIMGLGYILK